MHELSVALRIVEALDEELAGEGDVTASAVTIQIGALTGLVPEALLFAWDMATETSRLQGSRLDIEWVEASGYCAECRADRTITNLQSFRCPTCHTPITQVTGGNELEILTLEIVDSVPEPPQANGFG